MSAVQKEQWKQNKRKRKQNHIAGGEHFHKGLYSLGKKIDEKIVAHPELFPRMPTRQPTDRIHTIGSYIMGTQRRYTRADLYSIPDHSFIALMNKEENKDKDEFYYVCMRDVLRRLHQQWGISLDAQKSLLPMM